MKVAYLFVSIFNSVIAIGKASEHEFWWCALFAFFGVAMFCFFLTTPFRRRQF